MRRVGCVAGAALFSFIFMKAVCEILSWNTYEKYFESLDEFFWNVANSLTKLFILIEQFLFYFARELRASSFKFFRNMNNPASIYILTPSVLRYYMQLLVY